MHWKFLMLYLRGNFNSIRLRNSLSYIYSECPSHWVACSWDYNNISIFILTTHTAIKAFRLESI